MSDAVKRTKRLSVSWGPLVLMAAGALLIGLAVNSALQPAELPYEKTFVEAQPGAYKAVALQDAGSGTPVVRKMELRTPGVRGTLATANVATGADGRNVPLNWQNNVTEPVLFADLSENEVGTVLAAIRKHLSSDAVVLSWWDLSRKIRFIAEREAPLDDPEARGLILPNAWNEAADRIADSERAFWGEGVPQSDEKKFTHFIDALSLDETQGSEALRTLAPGKDVYVAVHLSDIWKMAAARPDQIEIGYKDFPGSGQSHGVRKAALEWIKEQKIDGPYAVELVGNAARLHYLKGKKGSDMLITKILPFSTSNPMQLDQLDLVYQHRGFWIYKLRTSSGA
ncbi:MAG: hypothetical protein A49_28450 [Methyloceanibacter sp.]|nr:MAG: hypothetical protein A49_28450 [Methyloceanibacter sp.]